MDKPKAIKKMVMMNRWTIEEICKIVGVTKREAAMMYKQYTGSELPPSLLMVGRDEIISRIRRAMVDRKHVLLHGDPGVGKTSSVLKAVQGTGKILKKINISDKRTGSLLGEELYGSHVTDSSTIFLFDEVDNFHWKSHAYFKTVLESSVVSIIMTCNDIKKISTSIITWIKKYGVVIKVSPPTKRDVEDFILQKFPDKIQDLDEIYDPDFRVVIRRLLYGMSESIPQERKITIENVAGAVFGERRFDRKMDIIKKCKDPYLWLITWLDYNASRFIRNIDDLADFLDKLSQFDSWAIATGKQFQQYMIAALPCSMRRGMVKFPASLFNAEKKVKKQEEETVIKSKVVKIVEESSTDTFDPNNW